MDPILIDDNIYIFTYRRTFGAGVQGPLTIGHLNVLTGNLTILFHSPDREFSNYFLSDKKIYFIGYNGSVAVVDLKTNQASMRAYYVNANIDSFNSVLNHNYAYKNDAGELINQDLSDPDSQPYIVPCGRDYGRLLESTSTTIFVASKDDYSIVAIDIVSGQEIAHFYLKSNPHCDFSSNDTVGKITVGDMEITSHFMESVLTMGDVQKKIKALQAHIANDLLFVGCKKAIHVFDLFSKNHIATLGPFNSLRKFALHGNKLVYEEEEKNRHNINSPVNFYIKDIH